MRPEERIQVGKSFSAMDANKDGVLAAEEEQAFLGR